MREPFEVVQIRLAQFDKTVEQARELKQIRIDLSFCPETHACPDK
jgi:hypothetical protein